jgi:hypothetical protein
MNRPLFSPDSAANSNKLTAELTTLNRDYLIRLLTRSMIDFGVA